MRNRSNGYFSKVKKVGLKYEIKDQKKISVQKSLFITGWNVFILLFSGKTLVNRKWSIWTIAFFIIMKIYRHFSKEEKIDLKK